MKIIRRPYFTFSLANAPAASAAIAPRAAAATIGIVGGGTRAGTTWRANVWSAVPPWESATRTTTVWAPTSEVDGVHSTSPVTASIVMPAGASRSMKEWRSAAGYGSEIVTWYWNRSPARTCAGGELVTVGIAFTITSNPLLGTGPCVDTPSVAATWNRPFPNHPGAAAKSRWCPSAAIVAWSTPGFSSYTTWNTSTPWSSAK